MRPLIGITGDFGTNSLGQAQTRLNQAYSRAIAEVGAAALVIPLDLELESCGALVARLDGLLFSGGGDIEPWRYGGDASGRLVDVSQKRDALELSLVSLAVQSRMPFLGICRGCQVVNVALGGSLYEDLATSPGSAIHHDVPGKESSAPAHEIIVETGTMLARTLGRESFGVNSHHHQGLRAIAPGLRVSATSPDGLAEAVELPEHPFGLAVQWHPEWLTHQEWTNRLFTAFAAAASKFR